VQMDETHILSLLANTGQFQNLEADTHIIFWFIARDATSLWNVL